VSVAGSEEEEAPDLWAEVVGQPHAVGALRAAATAPIHAYLLVGPRGSGKRAAARAFAADLLSAERAPEEVERIRSLVAHDRHPSVSTVVREGQSISTDQVREVVRRAAMAPPEGDLQVIVLDELHLVGAAAPMLLKSIEEPPESTVFLVIADDVPDELVTVASRCVRIDFSAVPLSEVRAALLRDGVDEQVATAAAQACGGDLGRARLLVHDAGLSARRQAWGSVRGRLDGTGATACVVADELMAGIDEVLEPLARTQAAELSAFNEMSEQLGGGRKGERSALEARHKREARRVRMDELRAGLAAMLEAYRRPLGEPESSEASASAFLGAAEQVQCLTDSLRFNPNEALALKALLVGLPR
jgi:DNA polymerase-3 subunit delta'